MSVGAVNKQTGERIPTAGMPAVDSVLSGTSTNPVQNKVVKAALDTKQDTLTFDDTPTDGSNNPVKSNGIYDSEKDIYAAMGEMGAKNLIPYPYDRESGYSSQGATVTYDENGVMTVNKVAGTGAAYFSLVSKTLNPNTKIVLKPDTEYILSLKLTNAVDTSVAVTKSTSGDIAAIRNKSDGYYETVFTTPSDVSVFTGVILYWASTATESNAVVEVMIRQANITDGTYQPYAKTNKQLTDDVALLESGKADIDMVAADFNAGTSYTAGNYCVQDGKLYKFKNNHSGAWSAADVDEVKITGELSALKSGLTNVQHSFTKRTFELSASYTASYYLFEQNIALNGWYPLAVASFRGTSVNVNISNVTVESSGNKLYCDVYNTNADTIPSDYKVSVDVLYTKSIMI